MTVTTCGSSKHLISLFHNYISSANKQRNNPHKLTYTLIWNILLSEWHAVKFVQSVLRIIIIYCYILYEFLGFEWSEGPIGFKLYLFTTHII